MKRLLNLFVSVAAAAMAFASCEMVVEDSVPQDEYVYTFTLGSADETKATIGENSVEWESGDKMGVYTKVAAGTVSNNAYGDITPGTPATMKMYSNQALAVGDYIYAYYPYSNENENGNLEVTLSIPTAQTEKNAMPMVAIPYCVESAIGSGQQDAPAGKIKFVNLGAVIEFNVYSTTAEYQSEKIQSVSFVADQAIAGSFTYDLSNVNYSDPATLTISGYEETTVVYTPSTPAPVPAEKASATKIRMVVAPGSYTGEVVVTTDKATYTYNISESKEFGRSAIKPLGLNLREDVRVENPVDDEDLVIATGNLTSGSTDVLLEAGKAIMYSDIKSEGTNPAEYTNPGRFYQDNIFTVNSYAGNIKEISITCSSDQYATSLKNSVSSLGSVTTSGNTVTLSLTTPSTTVTWTNSAQWRANTMSVTYVSNGEIAVMPRNLSFSIATANATVGQDFTEPSLKGNKTDDVTYTSSNPSVATVDASTGEVTLVAAGTTEITATASATDEFEAGEATYTLTVADAPQGEATKNFTVKSDDVVTVSKYQDYTATIDNRGWVVTFGGNNKSIGTNSNNRGSCTLASYTKYAVSPVTTTTVASAFASTTKINNVRGISYTVGGGKNQGNTKVYILYSSDGNSFSQISLTNGTQGSDSKSFEFEKCSGYFAVLFVATNSSGDWRLDNVDLTFTYTE